VKREWASESALGPAHPGEQHGNRGSQR
jgi:hypothetical protein